MKPSVYICYSIAASQGPALSCRSLSLLCLCPLPEGCVGDSPLCLLSGAVTLRLAGLEVRVSLPLREPGPNPWWTPGKSCGWIFVSELSSSRTPED